MHVGENIRKLRKQKGLTQAELAQRISRTESSIRKYESGQTTIPLDVIEKIASALAVPVLELLSFPLADVPTSELLAEIERRCK